ncbi:hypothetical protein RUM43_008257 [Polyplax serrata]|uniref:Receptor ligand binding region domain-containing protein n=1 Tax=Polyplax serrata TaxID=468196 RepID=A0AAN8PAC9_POLSC
MAAVASTVVAEMKKKQCNAAVGMKSLFDMIHEGPHKLMLFGAACTQVTDPIAKASKHWRLTQLSYADTHPMFTNDNFPNFFRIVPSENAFNPPRLKLLQEFNWTRVGTIYQNEPRYSLVSTSMYPLVVDRRALLHFYLALSPIPSKNSSFLLRSPFIWFYNCRCQVSSPLSDGSLVFL